MVFLHGGPGGGFSKRDRRFFNPKEYRIILFDQRGAGKSTPAGSLKGNTTLKLVDDIKKLLDHLGIRKAILFGGSWGSTLALVFAIRHHTRVLRLVLRGIYLGRKRDNDYFITMARFLFPEAYERFSKPVPRGADITTFYHEKMRDPKTRTRFSKEWVRYEMSALSLEPNPKKIEKIVRKAKPSFGLIENHYLANDCFLPANYILKNAQKVRVPVTIIHGRYDAICPPSAAYELHKAIKNSTLTYVLAGHSASDKEIEKALVKAMNAIA